MKYSTLGSSNLNISTIGFGCMSLGKDKAAGQRLIDRAIALGINYFDTADVYDDGLNETIVGEALGARRKDIIIATKVGNVLRPDGSGMDWDPSAEHIVKSLEASLRRLNTDYIDLYQLHGGTINDPIDETIEAFERLKKAGKIRYYGISSIRPNVIREYVNRSNISSVMMQYGLLDRRPEETCLPLLREKNIGVVARGSLAKGLLVDKEAKNFLNYDTDAVRRAAKLIQEQSAPSRSSAQTAIQFALANPAITSAVVGIRTMEQLEDVSQAPLKPWMTAAQITALSSGLPVNRYEEHRD